MGHISPSRRPFGWSNAGAAPLQHVAKCRGNPTSNIVKKQPYLKLPPTLRLSPELEEAFLRTRVSWEPEFRHLPPPVRFRASGALHAWTSALDLTPAGRAARAALSQPAPTYDAALVALVDGVSDQFGYQPDLRPLIQPVLKDTFLRSCDHLTFWLRGGALYEPTLPLSSLLGGTDLSADMPWHLLTVPGPALCILPHPEHRQHCSNASAVLVFEHEPLRAQTSGRRAFTFIMCRDDPCGASTHTCVLPVLSEEDTLGSSFEVSMAASLSRAESQGKSPEQLRPLLQDELLPMLEYTAKVLLYMRLGPAQVRQYTPYSSAPRVFAGLGRRKREERLAQLEQLYDRYIVGPATWAETELGTAGDELSAGHELPPHWRRGHFRQQAHGPRGSLRKLMFIAPTIVRADRLESLIGVTQAS